LQCCLRSKTSPDWWNHFTFFKKRKKENNSRECTYCMNFAFRSRRVSLFVNQNNMHQFCTYWEWIHATRTRRHQTWRFW
jgi:hypothetical protein